MASVDAQNVALEVSETLGKGKKVVLGEIIKRNGYSELTAKTPKNVTNTKSYQDTIANSPVVKMMIKHRNKILKQLESMDLSDEKHRDLVAGLDTLTKNIQLLTGKETDRTGLTFKVTRYGEGNNDSV